MSHRNSRKSTGEAVASERIKVYVRARPLNQEEMKGKVRQSCLVLRLAALCLCLTMLDMRRTLHFKCNVLFSK